MKATDVLMQEHRLIERVLDALETATDHLESAHDVRPGFFVDAAGFMAGFADGCHHRKEEGVLFGAMLESGVPGDGGVIDMMLDEHERGRAFTRAMRDGAVRLEGGDPAARDQVVRNARGYVALLRDHIAKEDEMLFPMAEEHLSPQRQDAVMIAYAKAEGEDAGPEAQAAFAALAARLEREARALGA